MKNILILYGSYGGGHFSAAKSIKDYIELNYPESHVDMFDCINYVNKYLNSFSIKTYTAITKNAPWVWGKVYYAAENHNKIVDKVSSSANRLMSNRIYKLIKKKEPDLIISTHPFASQMLRNFKRKKENRC